MADSILMTMQGKLRFTKEGVWLHDNAAVTHHGIALFFSKRLRYSEQHTCYIVEDGGKCVTVEVEDTPRVVVTIDTTVEPWQVISNSDLHEPFDSTRLRYAPSGELYYHLSTEPYQARLHRAAVQALSPWLNEQDGGFYFERSGISAKLRPRNDDQRF